MQGIVHELGGVVAVVSPAHGDVARIDHTGRGLFASVPQGFCAVRYHSRAATRVPPDLEVTAWCDGPDGPVVMGVQHRTRPLHGVQFHPESLLTEHGSRLVRNFVSLS
jgi:anthranilate/para-aminobenzoate synthase component II